MPCPFAFTLRIVYNGMSDIITLTATAPLERVAWLFQAKGAGPGGAGGAVVVGQHRDNEGIVACWVRLTAEQGWKSLWQGNGVRILSSILGRSLSEFLNEFVLQKLLPAASSASTTSTKDNNKDNDNKEDEDAAMRRRYQRQLMAGFLAGFTSVLLTYPLQYAAARITCQEAASVGGGRGGGGSSGSSEITSISNCLATTVQKAGVAGVFRGLGMTCASIISNQLVTFGLYEWANNNANRPGKDSPKAWIRKASKFAATQVVQLAALFAAYPFETISRRLQVSEPGRGSDVFRGHLYAGLTASILKTVSINLILAAYHSETMSRFDILRKLMMKLFH